MRLTSNNANAKRNYTFATSVFIAARSPLNTRRLLIRRMIRVSNYALMKRPDISYLIRDAGYYAVLNRSNISI